MGKGSLTLSRDQLKSLKNLKTYEHLVIKASDKGSNVVVMEKEFYRSMCMSILENRDWYKNISPK